MQQHRRDEIELGERVRTYLSSRAQNRRGSVRARIKRFVASWPYRWFDVQLPRTRQLPRGGSVRVRSADGWPGSWKGTVLGDCKAVPVEVVETATEFRLPMVESPQGRSWIHHAKR